MTGLKKIIKSSICILSLVLMMWFVYATTFTDTSAANFDLGWYWNTNGTNDNLTLSLANTSGIFFSRIFDTTASSTYNNLSWNATVPNGTNASVSLRVLSPHTADTNTMVLIHFDVNNSADTCTLSGGCALTSNTGTNIAAGIFANSTNTSGTSALIYNASGWNDITNGCMESWIYDDWKTDTGDEVVWSSYTGPPQNNTELRYRHVQTEWQWNFGGTTWTVARNQDNKWGDNEWHHIAYCWNMTALRSNFYIDGTQLNSVAITSGALPFQSGIFRLGARSSGGSAFDGRFDEFRITNNTYDFNASALFSPSYRPFQAGEGIYETKANGTTLFLRADNSFNDVNGIAPLVNSSIDFETGYINQGFNITSTSDRLCYDSNLINPNKGTVEMWVNSHEDWTTNAVRYFWQYTSNISNPAVNTIQLFKWNTDTILYVEYKNSAGTNSYIGTGALKGWKAGEWHHIAATWDNSTSPYLQLFIDGQLINRRTSAMGTVVNVGITSNMSIGGGAYLEGHQNGCRGVNPTYTSNAIFDEVTISNYSKTIEELNYWQGRYKTSPQTNLSELNIANNNYIQYRWALNSNSTATKPEIYDVSIDYNITDVTPPTLTVTSPTASFYPNGTILVSFSATDGVGVDDLWFYNETNNITYTTAVYVNVTRGNYTFIFYANDTSGNSAQTNVTFTVNSLPIINSVSLVSTNPSLNDSNNNLTATINSSDADGHNITPAYNWYKNNLLNATTIITDGLISYWSFNNDTLDYWGSNNASTLTNVSYASGIISNGMYFNSSISANLDFGDQSSLYIGAGNLTLSIWVKTTTISNIHGLMGNSLGSTLPNAGYELGLRSGAGNNGIFFRLGNGTNGIDTNPTSDITTNISNGAWHHIAATVDRNGISYIYFDGQQVGSKNLSNYSQSITQSANFKLGIWYTTTWYFNGTMDEPMVFNRFLSNTEIQQLYYGALYGGNSMNSGRLAVGNNWTLGARGLDLYGIGNELNSTQITINANTVPTTPVLNTPNYQTSGTPTILLNYSSTDVDAGDTVTYYVYADTNADPTTVAYNGTNSTYNFTGNPNTQYYWKVMASDSKVNTSNSTINTFWIQPNTYVSFMNVTKHRWNKNASVSYSTDRLIGIVFESERMLKYYNMRSTIYLWDAAAGIDTWGSNITWYRDLLSSGSVRYGAYSTYVSFSNSSSWLSIMNGIKDTISAYYNTTATDMSFSYGNESYQNFTQQVFLGARNSWTGDYTYDGVDYAYWKDYNSTSRMDSYTLVTVKSQFDSAYAAGGWWRQFDHWHNRDLIGYHRWNDTVAMMNYTSGKSDIYYGTSLDILEYIFAKDFVHFFNYNCTGTNLTFNSTFAGYLPSSFTVSQLQTPVTVSITKNASACNFTVNNTLAVEVNGVRTPITVMNSTSFWFELNATTNNSVKVYDGNSSSLINLNQPGISNITINSTNIVFSTNQNTDYIIYWSNNTTVNILTDLYNRTDAPSKKQIKVLHRGDITSKTTSHSLAIPTTDYENYSVSNISQIYITVTNGYGIATFVNANYTPSVYFTDPTNLSGNYSNNWIAVNVTSNDGNIVNVTIHLYNSTGLANRTNSTVYPFFLNFTNLAYGTYYFNATVLNSYGMTNSTQTINVTFLDLTSPLLSIVSPTSMNYTTKLIDFNISSNENLNYCKFTTDSWATNYTMTSTNATYFNYTGSMSDGTYTANFWCNDTSGNINSTEQVSFNVTLPKIMLNLIYPTAGINVSPNAFFNFTLNVTCLDIDCGNINISLDPTIPAEMWNKTFGGTNSDLGYSVQQTTDRGYALIGSTGTSLWFIKTNSSGNQEWNKTFATGATNSIGYSVQQTTDGGYIVAGESNNGTYLSIWFIKTNSTGEAQWNKTIRRASQDEGYSVQQTTDGGYIVAGFSYNGLGTADVIIIKTNSTGDQTWNKTFGNDSNYDFFAYSVQQTHEGDYMIAGTMVDNINGYNDLFVIKADSSGNAEWNLTFGRTDANDDGRAIRQTSDGSYIVVGYTKSLGAGSDDIWLIKIDSDEKAGLVSTTAGTRPFYTNDSNPRTINLNASQSQTLTFWINATGMLNNPFTFFVYANKTSEMGISNSTVKLNVTIVDITAPTWSNNKTYPALPANYSSTANHQFNTTWSDNSAIKNITIEHNFTGTLGNYTTLNNGAEYYYNYTSIKPGSYVWRMHAIDTSNNRNKTDQWTYVVNKSNGNVRLLLNGSQSGLAIATNTPFWINTTLVNGTGNILLYRNRTLINNGTSPLANLTNFTSSGTYNISLYYAGNENFTSTHNMFWVNIAGVNDTIADSETVTLSSTVTNVIFKINSSVQNVVVPSNVSSTKPITFDFSLLLGSGMVNTTNNITLTRAVSSTLNHTVEIFANTTMSSTSAWDGKVNIPIVNTTTFAAPNSNGTVTVMIYVGSSETINFSQPVKIILGGQSGKHAAWSNGSATLTNINTTCDSATNPTNINSTARECYIDSGSDLLIWTYHFTYFAAYTPAETAATAATTASSGNLGAYYSEFSEGSRTEKLNYGDFMSFKIKNTRHNVVVIKVINDAVTLRITSSPIDVALKAGETKEIDVNKNGINDFRIVLNSMTKIGGTFTFTILDENAPKTEAIFQPETPPAEEMPVLIPQPEEKAEANLMEYLKNNLQQMFEKAMNFKYIRQTSIASAALLSIIIIAIVLAVRKHKKGKHETNHHHIAKHLDKQLEYVKHVKRQIGRHKLNKHRIRKKSSKSL